jgi:hypothetical protein
MEFYCDQFWFCNAMPPEWHWVMPLGMPLLLIIIVAVPVAKYPASSWTEPMVDDPRVCAAGKSDRLMGVCVHPMAQRLGRWPAGVTNAVMPPRPGSRGRGSQRTLIAHKEKPRRSGVLVLTGWEWRRRVRTPPERRQRSAAPTRHPAIHRIKNWRL